MKFVVGDEDDNYGSDEQDLINNDTVENEEMTECFSNKKKAGRGRKAGIILLMVILILILGYQGYIAVVGPGRKECKELIENLEVSCNELNLLGIADCMKPSVRNIMYVAVTAGSVLTQTDAEDLLKEAINMLMGVGSTELVEESDMTISDLIKRIKIKPVRYGLPGKTRTIICRITFGGITKDVRLAIRKQYGEVFINGISLVD